jgi:hypothetical protein
MPPALAKALAGAREGEYRLFSATADRWYVLRIVRHVPSAVRPLQAVKTEIIKKLFDENTGKAVKAWAAKVREATDVEIFITSIDY